ncbi:putative membrane protein [Caldithrix abyssi DSM 13497]|nr:putative membrane protein [Caldithrix abyssi DSM 13497]
MFGMGFGSIFGILILLLIGWGVLNFVNVNRGQRTSFLPQRNAAGASDALEILKQRYARGEISKEEYERMKQDITGL